MSDDTQHGTVGVRLKGTDFDAVSRIPANKEGEALYVLYPKTMKVAHRLVCEVKLREDKVKHITFRSALLVENNSQIPIELKVGNDAGAKITTIGKFLCEFFLGLGTNYMQFPETVRRYLSIRYLIKPLRFALVPVSHLIGVEKPSSGEI